MWNNYSWEQGQLKLSQSIAPYCLYISSENVFIMESKTKLEKNFVSDFRIVIAVLMASHEDNWVRQSEEQITTFQHNHTLV